MSNGGGGEGSAGSGKRSGARREEGAVQGEGKGQCKEGRGIKRAWERTAQGVRGRQRKEWEGAVQRGVRGQLVPEGGKGAQRGGKSDRSAASPGGGRVHHAKPVLPRGKNGETPRLSIVGVYPDLGNSVRRGIFALAERMHMGGSGVRREEGGGRPWRPGRGIK